MKINISYITTIWNKIYAKINSLPPERTIGLGATVVSIIGIAYAWSKDFIVLYGDAESHLNIAKRVVHSITPGIAQVGGIWLPLPHLMMVPFIWIEPLYRTGIAGAIVSGIGFVVSCIYLYKLTVIVSKHKIAGLITVLVFGLNPNILYMQSTPMTEMVLIMFFILSSYYFVKYLYDQTVVIHLVMAGLFGLGATLSRYDGWFLVIIEAIILLSLLVGKRINWSKLEGLFLLFGSIAFVGVLCWLIWGFMILGDPLYFTNSQFSAKSQQNAWNSKGQLPAYNNLANSVLYYTFTAMGNTGVIVFGLAMAGFITYLVNKKFTYRYHIALLLLVPFIFYVVTMYLGQSVIFIPSITPVSFEWRLFNVRYGIMMVPFAAFFTALLFMRMKSVGRMILIGLLLFQYILYGVQYSKIITFEDGYVGLSHAKRPDAEKWLRDHYDGGLVLIDDYARTVSVVRSNVPMQKIIYIGNKPYWEESLKEPEKYAQWIVMQKDDSVWNAIYEDPEIQGRLFAHFQKVYTSDEILIFHRTPDDAAPSESI